MLLRHGPIDTITVIHNTFGVHRPVLGDIFHPVGLTIDTIYTSVAYDCIRVLQLHPLMPFTPSACQQAAEEACRR